MKIRFIGAHNTEAGPAKLPGVLVDEVLALDAGCLNSLMIPEQLALKSVLITHQHYDHLRDLPILGMNLQLNSASLAVHGPLETRVVLTKYLLNGVLYPRFLEGSILDYHLINPGEPFWADGYNILPVAMRHSVPAVGYEISAKGKRLFYSGDTGPGLSDVWEHLRPDLIIIEVTAPNSQTSFGCKAGHLSASLLQEELASFKKLNGYLPPVYVVHMNPFEENDIQAELVEVEHALNCHITPAHEGLEIEV